eukprot:905865-Prorocentrum_lima.AAC.1
MTNGGASVNIGGITYVLRGGASAFLRRSAELVTHFTAALAMFLTDHEATVSQVGTSLRPPDWLA